MRRYLLIPFLTASVLHGTDIPVLYQFPPEPPQLFADSTYQLGWDINMSPYAGGEDLLFGLRCIERAEGYLLANNPACFSKSLPARIWRLSELVTIWLPLNYLAIVAEHEVFGHGYRIRDINHGRVKVGEYEIGVPIPYGSGGGATYYSISEQFTSSNATAVAMAGVESTAILAQLTKLKWLESGKVDPRQTVLYILGQFDLPLYVGDLKTRGNADLDGHDMNDYIKTLNVTYTNSRLEVSTLNQLSLINFADAFTYYSIYAWIRYVASGNEASIPMIPVWGYGWLPGARMGLTPFGPEYFAENYLLKGKIPYYFYLKGGNHSDNTYLGVGFFAPTIWIFGGWSFGARFDAWYQPKYLEEQGSESFYNLEPNPSNPLYSYSEQHKKISGAGATILITYKSKGRSGGQLEIGGKSQGFLPGNALRAAPIARVYYNLLF